MREEDARDNILLRMNEQYYFLIMISLFIPLLIFISESWITISYVDAPYYDLPDSTLGKITKILKTCVFRIPEWCSHRYVTDDNKIFRLSTYVAFFMALFPLIVGLYFLSIRKSFLSGLKYGFFGSLFYILLARILQTNGMYRFNHQFISGIIYIPLFFLMIVYFIIIIVTIISKMKQKKSE